MKKTFILSLGGSLIAPPRGIDHLYLKKFRQLILNEVKKGSRFFIITGGGAIARAYQKTAGQTAKMPAKDRDWIGIYATHFHAHFLRVLFGSAAHPEIIVDPTVRQAFKKRIILGAGWKPGCSTDKDAVLLARTYKIKTIVNLTNTDYVYDKDPKKFKSAKKLFDINWPELRKIVGDEWRPGLNAPFDPVASRLAARLGLKVIILNGRNLPNLKYFLAGKKFKGTIIRNVKLQANSTKMP